MTTDDRDALEIVRRSFDQGRHAKALDHYTRLLRDARRWSEGTGADGGPD